MRKKKQKTKPCPIEFLACLESNEEMMGEGAAMAVTCEIYGIEMHEGYELLADHPEMVEVKQ